MPENALRKPRASTVEEPPAWSLPGLREPRYSQSLERGVAILACFTPKRPVLGIADLADELDMTRSTTRRYVLTLTALGYLEQGAHRKYRLGLRVTDLGMSALNSTGLRDHARPYLEELRQQSTYTASLAVLDGSEIVYVDRARSLRRRQSEIELGLAPGSRLPAYCTAMGKLLLANLPEKEQDERLASMRLTKRGPNTITSRQALRAELEEILEKGFAVNDEELAPELHSIAAPVRNEVREVVAAASLAPIPRRSHSRSSSTRSSRTSSRRPIASPRGWATGGTTSKAGHHPRSSCIRWSLPSWPGRWASSRTTSTAFSPAWSRNRRWRRKVAAGTPERPSVAKTFG